MSLSLIQPPDTSSLSSLGHGQFIAAGKTGNYKLYPQGGLESRPFDSEVEAIKNIAELSAYSVFGNAARVSQKIEPIKVGEPLYVEPSSPNIRDYSDTHCGKKYECLVQKYVIVLEGMDPGCMNRNNPELEFEVYQKVPQEVLANA